ncbi:MAG: radical SAM protein [Candidatus Bathyarchaeota archaeon]|nr:radical SAM protein [Candidatus Bathyarchaeota archaeon]
MISRKQRKWRYLSLGARWDRCVVPIYEAAAGGKVVPLLKTLLTSYCKNDCKYCAMRAHGMFPRSVWDPDKLARVTMHLWQKGEIKGLFLSSSIFKDPDYTVEKELEAVRALRGMGYTAYIHLRVMPGTSRYLIKEAVRLADRVGVNIEAPNKDVFSEICPDKGGFENAVLKRLEWIACESRDVKNENVNYGFAKSGVDTQVIVGAVDDNDWQFLKITEQLYRKLGLRRVYFSGFEPIQGSPLGSRKPCSPSREYRLYQSSFLIRDYGFKIEDFKEIVDDEGFLPNVDPKITFARANPDLFPIDLNSASQHEMMLIPNIGPTLSGKILKARNDMKISYLKNLEKILGANLARRVAAYVHLKDKKLSRFK